MPDTIERKSSQLWEVKADKSEGVIEAIVSVFGNVDNGNEVVEPGFFKDSLGKRMPKGVWMHDWKTPVAKTLVAKELLPGDPQLPESLKANGGAYIKAQFNLDTQRGREAFSDIAFGLVDEYSIGYKVDEDKWDTKAGPNGSQSIRRLIKGRWFEWSPVLVGMNDRTTTLTVKADGADEPEPLALSDEVFYFEDDDAVATVHQRATVGRRRPAPSRSATGSVSIRAPRDPGPRHAASRRREPSRAPASRDPTKTRPAHPDLRAVDGRRRLPGDQPLHRQARLRGHQDQPPRRLRADLDGRPHPDPERDPAAARRWSSASPTDPTAGQFVNAKEDGADNGSPSEDAAELAENSLSFEQVTERVSRAINRSAMSLGGGYIYVIATYPSNVIVRRYDSDGSDHRYFRVDYSMNPDGSIQLGEAEEVRQTYAPVKADRPVAAEMKALIDGANEAMVEVAADIKEGRTVSTSTYNCLAKASAGIRQADGEIGRLLAMADPRRKGKKKPLGDPQGADPNDPGEQYKTAAARRLRALALDIDLAASSEEENDHAAG